MSGAEPQQGSGLVVDLRAGVVVCLVALPLCLGIAMASGAPLASGLVTGVIGGLVVSAIGGTALLVSGPAAGLAAIVLAAIAELGSFEALLAALVIAGLMQLGLGLARAGRLAGLVPSSVVSGMLVAIGVLLILQQMPHALGATLEGGAHGLEMLLLPVRAIANASAGPTVIAVATLAIILAWDRLPFGSLKKILPGALIAVIGGTLLAEAFPLVAPTLALDAKSLVRLPDTSEGFGAYFATPDWSAMVAPATWRVAVTLAIVASLETLLSMEATDRLDPLKRRSNGDRELVAQGIGNTLAGLIGGLPMTGVIVRSSANVAAGGRTWRSAFAHGVMLAAAIIAVPVLLERIPLAALAAVLLHTGWKLAHPARFQSAVRLGAGFAIPLFATVVGVILTDLLIGVGIGLAVGGIVALTSASRHGVEVERDVVEHGKATAQHLQLRLAPAVSFVHKPRIHDLLQGAPVGGEITVDGSRTRDFDHDVVELLHGFSETARDRGISYRLVGVPDLPTTPSH